MKIFLSIVFSLYLFFGANSALAQERVIGDIKNGKVSGYLQTSLMSIDKTKEALKKAGFEILGVYKIDRKGLINSIIFTNEILKEEASKRNRGFIANLRVTIDEKNKLTVISNPLYLMGAFMQDEYDSSQAMRVLKQLNLAFANLKESKDIVEFSSLKDFHFMINMPYYQDMEIVKKGDNEKLLAKIKKSKKLIFEQHLSNGSIVVGVALGKRTTKFVKKIGFEKAGLLPYPILIENNEAKYLAPKYYISVMYPMLNMSQFMKIATTPGAISKDIKKIFR
jgi:hypothetical protein